MVASSAYWIVTPDEVRHVRASLRRTAQVLAAMAQMKYAGDPKTRLLTRGSEMARREIRASSFSRYSFEQISGQ